MASSAEQQHYIEALRSLHREEQGFTRGPRLEFINRSESRDQHHRQPAAWAGELQAEFGQHRRGPTSRHW